MNTTTQPQETNDLRHTIMTKNSEGNTMRINISLNDKCNNGHQDFAITADIWEKGKPMNDRYCIMGGCCHEEILKVHPELQIFVNLHLCDYKGIPMHAVENGFYHLTNGFNSTTPSDEKFKSKFCSYYRVFGWQFDRLLLAENKLQYALLLKDLHILDQWGNDAVEGIRLLETMTGKKFLMDSKKANYAPPSEKEIDEEKKKQESGYYSPEAKEERKKEAAAKIETDLLNKERKEIEKIREEYSIKVQVLNIGGKAALDNCIYYSHTRQLTFNWKSYDRISDELIAKIAAEIKLPEGATIKNENKK